MTTQTTTPPAADRVIAWDRVWWWRARIPERKGTACRVLARGARNTQHFRSFLAFKAKWLAEGMDRVFRGEGPEEESAESCP